MTKTPFLPTRAPENPAVLPAGVLLAALLAPAMPALAQSRGQQALPDELQLNGSLSVGTEYNDNLSVPQLETFANRSDMAGTVDGNLALSWQATPRVSLETSYAYTLTDYQDLDAYDLELHLLSAGAAWDVAGLTLGGDYYFATADLGDNSFLDLDQVILHASRQFGETWFLRGAVNLIDKDFVRFNERDADNNGIGIDVYRFFNEGRSNLTLGYGYEDEDTRGPSFDYQADTIRLGLNHRFLLASREATLQLGYRLQDRDYANATPSIGRPRDDRQQVLNAGLELNLTGGLAVLTRWEHGNFDSYLPSADFDENRISAQLKYAF